MPIPVNYICNPNIQSHTPRQQWNTIYNTHRGLNQTVKATILSRSFQAIGPKTNLDMANRRVTLPILVGAVKMLIFLATREALFRVFRPTLRALS